MCPTRATYLVVFTRPLKINNDQWSTDLNNDWYQLYAWGPVTTSKCYFICHFFQCHRSSHEAKKSYLESYRTKAFIGEQSKFHNMLKF